jgi:preprotein translocase subunit SecF
MLRWRGRRANEPCRDVSAELVHVGCVAVVCALRIRSVYVSMTEVHHEVNTACGAVDVNLAWDVCVVSCYMAVVVAYEV